MHSPWQTIYSSTYLLMIERINTSIYISMHIFWSKDFCSSKCHDIVLLWHAGRRLGLSTKWLRCEAIVYVSSVSINSSPVSGSNHKCLIFRKYIDVSIVPLSVIKFIWFKFWILHEYFLTTQWHISLNLSAIKILSVYCWWFKIIWSCHINRPSNIKQLAHM